MEKATKKRNFWVLYELGAWSERAADGCLTPPHTGAEEEEEVYIFETKSAFLTRQKPTVAYL